jgi:hypothetical protein
VSECREVQLGEVCYTSAGVSQTLFVTHVYDHDGSLVAVVYHDVAGNPVDTSAGVVGIGRCDCPKTFVEQGCLKVVTANVLPGTFETHTIDTSVITHLHWVFDAVTGLGYPGAIPIPGPNPTPIDLTDVAAVQAQIDAAFGAGVMGYYWAAPSTGIFYALNATAAATYVDAFWIGDISDYTSKDSLDAFDPVPAPSTTELQQVEVIKTVACDGTISVVLYAKDGSLLVPQPLAAEWTLGACQTVLDRIEVCVDTGTAVVEAWIVHVRDAISGVILSSSMEDINGAAVTGTIVDCVCSTGPVTPLLEARNTYTGSGIQSYYTDKWTTDCGPITWQVEAYQNGAIVYTSPMSPALGSGAAAQTWLNTVGGGGYVLLNSFNDAPNGNFAVNNWSLPVQSSGDWLIVVKETANSAGPGGCVANIDYGFANYDIASLGNGNPTGWWDSIGSGINPTSGALLGWQIG